MIGGKCEYAFSALVSLASLHLVPTRVSPLILNAKSSQQHILPNDCIRLARSVGTLDVVGFLVLSCVAYQKSVDHDHHHDAAADDGSGCSDCHTHVLTKNLHCHFQAYTTYRLEESFHCSLLL